MNSKNVLQPSKGNKARKGNETEQRRKATSTPVKEESLESESNISHLSNIPSSLDKSSKSKGSNTNIEKENLQADSLARDNLIELKSVMFQRSNLFHQHKEHLENINRQITELREKLEQEKQEVYSTITAFKEISLVEKRCEVESLNQAVLSDGDIQLQQRFEELMAAVNQERNELKLKNISFFSDEQCKKLLKEAGASIKSFHDSGEFEAVEKLSSFLPALEESIEKCNASNEKCAKITEGIRSLLLHRNTLRAINNEQQPSIVGNSSGHEELSN